MNQLLMACIAAYTVLEKALPAVFIGLFLANLMSIGRFAAQASRLLPKLERFTGLPSTAVLVIVLSVADRTAGMAALEGARKQDGLSDKQVIAINLAAKAPSVVQFFVFSFLPLLLALFPSRQAVVFLISYFAAFLLLSLIGLVLLKLWSDTRLTGRPPAAVNDSSNSWGQGVKAAFIQTLRPFGRIALWMFAMSVLVMLLVNSGALAGLSGLAHWSGGLLGPNAIPLVGAGLISMVGGVAAVGTAWQEGIIPAESIVPLLFLLSIIHNLYDLFASSLPRTIAVYGRELGLKVGITGFVITEVVMLLFFWLALAGVLG